MPETYSSRQRLCEYAFMILGVLGFVKHFFALFGGWALFDEVFLVFGKLHQRRKHSMFDDKV